jgi:hypothetical protein
MALRRGGAVAIALMSAALVLGAVAGCGGSGSSSATAGGSTAPGASTAGRYAIEAPALSRGIKGETPSAEPATTLALSAADCARLAGAAESRLGRKLGPKPKPTPPLSACAISGRGVSIDLTLDSGFAAHQRYMNRMVEAVQFGAPDPGKVPHPVAGVGEKGAYNEYANWIPDFGTLYAVRGNRWITVNYSAAGRAGQRAREEAADLTRLAFRLTAR